MFQKRGMAGELRESVGTYDALLFMEEEMGPIFCKPKLLPMKTLTMEKLEQMQREAEKLVRQHINPVSYSKKNFL